MDQSIKTICLSKNQIVKNLAHIGDGFLSILAGLASKALPFLAKGMASGFLGAATEQLFKKKADFTVKIRLFAVKIYFSA